MAPEKRVFEVTGEDRWSNDFKMPVVKQVFLICPFLPPLPPPPPPPPSTTTHQLDANNDLRDVQGFQNASHTIVSFRRAVRTGDAQDLTIEGVRTLSWATGTSAAFLQHSPTDRGVGANIDLTTGGA